MQELPRNLAGTIGSDTGDIPHSPRPRDFSVTYSFVLFSSFFPESPGGLSEKTRQMKNNFRLLCLGCF